MYFLFNPFSEIEGAARLNRIDICALGSPYGIDRLAWSVLERMEQAARDVAQPPWRFACVSGSEQLLERWSQEAVAQAIIMDTVVDYACEKISLRRIFRQELEDMPSGFSGHGLTLESVLKLADELHLTPPTLLIIGLTVPDARMAHPHAGVVERLVGLLQRELSEWDKPRFQRDSAG